METLELQLRDAIAKPSSWNPAERTIVAVIATATPVSRRDAKGDFDEVLDVRAVDLSSMAGVSVLDGHAQGGTRSVIGVIDEAHVEGNDLVATLRLSGRADVADIVRDIGDGILRNLSVGYSVTKWRDTTDPITKKRTRTATAFRIAEVSIVAVPADPSAKTRSIKMSTTETTVADPVVERASVNKQIRELATRAGASLSVANDLIDRQADITEARAAILDDIVTRGAVAIRSGGRDHNATSLDNPEVFQRAAMEGLYVRLDPNYKPAAQGAQFVGWTQADLARECLSRAGVATQGMQAQSLITRALQTTSDYPSILAGILDKSMRIAYGAQPSGIRRVAKESSAQDFRTKSRIQFDSSGFTLTKVTEGGEFTYGAFVDSAESYAIDSYGKLFAISRKALINDDIGVFNDITRRTGQAAAEFERQFLVNLLISQAGLGPNMSDGTKLFDASHGNVNAAAVIGLTSLTAARLLMRQQTGPGGGLISATPKYLVVPSALETIAEQTVASIQATKTSDTNPFAFLEVIVEPRLVSLTRWYLWADPSQIDGLEFAYLAGAPGPQTESKAGFEFEGVTVKVRLDYGAGFIDWRGVSTSAGA